jgi:23S rRNA pseudouridine1911/1915/1917 synthase
VNAVEAGERLDRFLARHCEGLSRTRIKGLIEAGEARVDGHLVTEAGYLLKTGQSVRLRVPSLQPAQPMGEAMPLTIVYEDDDLIVIDKAAGLVVHPGAGNASGTLVNALIAHCGASLSGIGGVARPGIVHRLDKDTSGLMVVAKNDLAHQRLAAQFADHGRSGALRRAYRAFVWGTARTRRIETGLERSARNREKMAVVPLGRGRAAITEVSLLETYGHHRGEAVASAVECRLETGRTHQIRVHMAHEGHPLMGDALYGQAFRTKASLIGEEARDALSALGRQALHARLLGFEHPRSGKSLLFESALPPDLEQLAQALKLA